VFWVLLNFCGFGATNSIGTFVNPSTFASTFVIHGPTAFGEPTKKRKKKVLSRGFSRKNGLPNFLGLNML
jgi:hypothetical protein